MQHLSGIRAHHLVAKRFQLAISSASVSEEKQRLEKELCISEKELEFLCDERTSAVLTKKRLVFVELELNARLRYIDDEIEKMNKKISSDSSKINSLDERIESIRSKEKDLDFLEEKLNEIAVFGEIVPARGYFTIANMLSGLRRGLAKREFTKAVTRTWKNLKFNCS